MTSGALKKQDETVLEERAEEDVDDSEYAMQEEWAEEEVDDSEYDELGDVAAENLVGEPNTAQLPPKCLEFLVQDCGLDDISADTPMAEDDFEKTFTKCCKKGGHGDDVCTALKKEVFGTHQ